MTGADADIVEAEIIVDVDQATDMANIEQSLR